MQVSIETKSALERCLAVDVPAEKIDSQADQRLKKVASSIRVNGFRKGKAPLKLVRQQYGEEIRQEVLADVINTSLQDAFKQEKLQPAGQPTIEVSQFESGKDLKYLATFEVFPEVVIGSFNDFSIEKPVAEIHDVDIDNMVNNLREQKATYPVVERAAAEGDKVNVSYVGTREGEAFESGQGDHQDIVIGSGSMIPGFEEGLIGLAAGDQKQLSLRFPEDYHAEELKGVDVEFAVTIHAVSEKLLPVLDVNLLGEFGVTHGDLDQFRADIVQNMERELSFSVKEKVKVAVMDQLLEANPIAVPKALINSEIKVLREQMMQQFGGLERNNNTDLSALLPDDIFKERAERRVRLGLLLDNIITVNGFKADAERVRSAIEGLSASYQNPEAMIQHYYENSRLLSGVEASVLEDMAVDFILESATVTEKTVPYEEAVKKQQQ